MTKLQAAAEIVGKATFAKEGDGIPVSRLIKSLGLDPIEARNLLHREVDRYVRGGGAPQGAPLEMNLAAFGIHMFCVGAYYATYAERESD